MTQFEKLQLAVRNCTTHISNGSARRSLLAASLATYAQGLFPMGSFGYAVASSFSELCVNPPIEEQRLDHSTD